jgi:hypothetical protein
MSDETQVSEGEPLQPENPAYWRCRLCGKLESQVKCGGPYDYIGPVEKRAVSYAN